MCIFNNVLYHSESFNTVYNLVINIITDEKCAELWPSSALVLSVILKQHTYDRKILYIVK